MKQPNPIHLLSPVGVCYKCASVASHWMMLNLPLVDEPRDGRGKRLVHGRPGRLQTVP